MMLIDENNCYQLVCENLKTIIYIKIFLSGNFSKFNKFSDRLISIYRIETERKEIRFVFYVLTF